MNHTVQSLLQGSVHLSMAVAMASLFGCQSADHHRCHCDSGDRDRQSSGPHGWNEGPQDDGPQPREERQDGGRRVRAPQAPADQRPRRDDAGPGREPERGGHEQSSERETLEWVHAQIHRRLDEIEQRLQALEGRGAQPQRNRAAR